MSPKLKSLAARLVLVGGVTGLVAFSSRHLPHEQTLAIRLNRLGDNREVSQVSAVVTRVGDDEASAGFTQKVAPPVPRILRHTFSAPNGTYIVVITLKAEHGGSSEVGSEPRREETAGSSPIPTETTFERRVSLAGGEVIVSPE